MDMLRKLVEEKMRKGEHSENDEESSKKKTAQLGVLAHISKMAEGAMADDLKNNVSGHNTSSADAGSGMKEGVDRAEEMVSDRGNPLHTDVFDEDEDAVHREQESPAHEANESAEEEDAEEEDRKHKGYR